MELVECACGCNGTLPKYDAYKRERKFINGHNRRKYYGDDATNWAREKRWRTKRPDIVRRNKRDFYHKRKLMAMECLGNKCSSCNLEYNGRNAPVFDFHHTDPEGKEIGVSRIVSNRTWKKVKLELDKCVLLCRNCHSQLHGGEW